MIKTLSPYYISTPFIHPATFSVSESYTLRIYVWKGNKTAVPSEPSYEMTKINASLSSGNDRVNIARIVNGFIDFNCTQYLDTDLVDGLNQAWVKTEVYYNGVSTSIFHEDYILAIKGYGFFLDGENPQVPANKILLEGDEFKVNRTGYFVLPIMMAQPPDYSALDYDNTDYSTQ